MPDRTPDLDQGDFFKFEGIIVQARKVSKPKLIRLTGNHRGTRTKHALGKCVVDAPWRIVEKKN